MVYFFKKVWIFFIKAQTFGLNGAADQTSLAKKIYLTWPWEL
jgi:hypothetical protein